MALIPYGGIIKLLNSLSLFLLFGLLSCSPAASDSNSSNNSQESGISTPNPGTQPKDIPCNSRHPDDCKLLLLVNQARQQNNLNLLVQYQNCQNEANYHADDMNVKNYFSHTSADGTTTEQRMNNFNISGLWGENIAYSSSPTADQIFNAWMNSPGHRANILNANFKSMANGSSGSYYVQCFSGFLPK